MLQTVAPAPTLTASVIYARDTYGFIRQCAWCLRVADASGQYSGPAQPLITNHDATHGICRPCAASLVVDRRAA